MIRVIVSDVTARPRTYVREASRSEIKENFLMFSHRELNLVSLGSRIIRGFAVNAVIFSRFIGSERLQFDRNPQLWKNVASGRIPASISRQDNACDILYDT